MSQVVWLDEAIDDLQRLRIFLEDKNPSAAQRVAETLLEGAELLGKFPEFGRPMDDDTERRELVLPFGSRSYVMRYIYSQETVFILRAWHSRESRSE